MKHHAHNVLSHFGFEALSRLLGFSLTLYLARVLETDTFGVINYGMSVVAYGLLFVSPGLHVIGTRMISRHELSEQIILRKISSLRILLSIIAAGLIIAAAFLFTSDSVMRVMVILYSLSLLPHASLIEWYFQGKEQIRIIGQNRVVGSLSFLVLIILFVGSSRDALRIPVLYFLSIALNSGILFIRYKRKGVEQSAAPESAKSTLDWSLLLKLSLPVGFAFILTQIVLNFPMILLGAFSTTSEIAQYSAAAKLVFFLLALDRGIYFLFFPVLSRTMSAHPEAVTPQIHAVVKYVLVVIFPVCVGGTVLAPALIQFIYGSRYAGAVVLFQILNWYFLFTVLNSIFTFVLIAHGEEKRYSRIIVTLSLVVLVLLVPAAYVLGGIGAALGMTIGEGFLMGAMLYEAKKIYPIRFFRQSIRSFFASALMGVIVYSVGATGLLLPVGIGIVSYAILMILFRGITNDDIRYLKERFV